MDERRYTHDGATYTLQWDDGAATGVLRCVSDDGVAWTQQTPVPDRAKGYDTRTVWRIVGDAVELEVAGEHWKIGSGPSYRWRLTPDGARRL